MFNNTCKCALQYLCILSHSGLLRNGLLLHIEFFTIARRSK